MATAPCLVLGLGGTAGLVLNGLRRRWSDRFGDLAAMPALQMLLVDSDRRSLAEATGGDPSRALQPCGNDTMPLRGPEEYHAARGKISEVVAAAVALPNPAIALHGRAAAPGPPGPRGSRPGMIGPTQAGDFHDDFGRRPSRPSQASSWSREICPSRGPADRLRCVDFRRHRQRHVLDAAYPVRKVLADFSSRRRADGHAPALDRPRSSRQAAGTGQRLCLPPRIADLSAAAKDIRATPISGCPPLPPRSLLST